MRRTFVVALAALSLAGCYKWEIVQPIGLVRIVPETNPDQVRVVLRGTRSYVRLRHPIISGDSIGGAVIPTQIGTAGPPQTLIALEDVGVAEVRSFDTLMTAALVGGAALVAIAIVAVIEFAKCDDLLYGC